MRLSAGAVSGCVRVGVQLGDELRGGDARVGIDEDLLDLSPVDPAVEPDTDPTAVPDVRGHVEPVWLLVDQLLLHARRSGADEAEPLVAVMVVPGGGKRLLVPDEPGRRAVAQPLVHLRQSDAQLAYALDRIALSGHRDSLVPP